MPTATTVLRKWIDLSLYSLIPIHPHKFTIYDDAVCVHVCVLSYNSGKKFLYDCTIRIFSGYYSYTYSFRIHLITPFSYSAPLRATHDWMCMVASSHLRDWP